MTGQNGQSRGIVIAHFPRSRVLPSPRRTRLAVSTSARALCPDRERRQASFRPFGETGEQIRDTLAVGGEAEAEAAL
jgi:hypothetical protein